MTARFDAFKAELIALCDKHKVQVSTSIHDCIAVNDRDMTSDLIGDEAIYMDAIEDETTDGEANL